MTEKTMQDILGAYSNILYTCVANSELPTYAKVKVIELIREARKETIASWLEKRKES